LQQNDQITVNWCKAHSGIAGNVRADALATQARLAKTGEDISASI
ncbi:RNase H family protein, partial [Chryseobacterium sp. SIMBA_028]